jgi:hypothetical protein
MGAVITSKLPCHYVDYLCHPELKTRGGIVPLHALLDLDQSWTASNPSILHLQRFRAKRIPVRVKKARQNKGLKPRF